MKRIIALLIGASLLTGCEGSEKLTTSNNGGIWNKITGNNKNYVGIEWIENIPDISQLRPLADGKWLLVGYGDGNLRGARIIYDKDFHEIKDLGDVGIVDVSENYILYTERILHDREFINGYGIMDDNGNIIEQAVIGNSGEDVLQRYKELCMGDTIEIEAFFDDELQLWGLKEVSDDTFIENEFDDMNEYVGESYITLNGITDGYVEDYSFVEDELSQKEKLNENIVLEPTYVEMECAFVGEDQYIVKNEDGMWGIIDSTGKVLLDLKYSQIDSVASWMAWDEPYYVIYNEKAEAGIFTMDGQLFDPQFKNAYRPVYFDGYVIDSSGNDITIYDISGKVIKEIDSPLTFYRSQSINQHSNEEYYTGCIVGTECKLYDKKFNEVTEEPFVEGIKEFYMLNNGVLVYKKSDGYHFYNKDTSYIGMVKEQSGTANFIINNAGDEFAIGWGHYRLIEENEVN